MNKEHTLPDGYYKIHYYNREYYIVKNNLIKRIIIENRNQSINSSGYYTDEHEFINRITLELRARIILGLWIDFVSLPDCFTKNLVPLTDEEKVELL